MKIHHLTLNTTHLQAQRDFYTIVMGLPLAAESPGRFTLRAGRSLLTFQEKEEALYYHFAFNIPSFQSREALAWLESRVHVLDDQGKRLIDFRNWNAEAMYFYDPAGNIVEFIARRRLELPNREPFDALAIGPVSEIGLPVENIQDTFDLLHGETGLLLYWGNYEDFCAAGDEHGLFIIVEEKEKKWYPTEKAAVGAPFELEFGVNGERVGMRFDGKMVWFMD